MNCPEWCSRQLFAFIMSGLTGKMSDTLPNINLLLSGVSYRRGCESMVHYWQHDLSFKFFNSPNNTMYVAYLWAQISKAYLPVFWWKGVYTSVQMKSGVHNNEILDWNDENVFNSTLPRDRYFICAGLAVGSLAVSLLLCVGVIVLLMCTCVRRKLKRILARSIKWYLAGLNVLVLVLSAIAFGSFIEYPSALEVNTLFPSWRERDHPVHSTQQL